MTADLGKLMRENQLLFAEFVRRYDEAEARLAAAERVVEAARGAVQIVKFHNNAYPSSYRVKFPELEEALDGYEKAYSGEGK